MVIQNFNAGDVSDLADYVESGVGWSNFSSGTSSVSSGKATGTSGFSGYLLDYAVGSNDVEVQADYVLNSNVAGVRARVHPTNFTGYVFVIATTFYRIQKFAPGSAITLATVTTTTATSGRAKITVVGDTITGYVDGVQVVQVTDSTYTTGEYAATYLTTNATLDNFFAQPLTYPGTAYQDTLDDATLEDYLPFDDNAASTTYTNLGNSGRAYAAYTGNSSAYHVAAAGTEPFYDWLPGGSFLNSSTARWVGCDLTSTGTYTALTACAWFKSSDADGSIYNFWTGSAQRAFLDLDTDGTLDAYVTDGTNIKRRKYAGSLADGQWHLGGLVWDAATDDLLLFLDGEFVTPTSSPNDDTIASVSAYGRHSWGGRLDSNTTKRLDANLVGARRYSSAQTLEQLQAMYYGPTWAPVSVSRSRPMATAFSRPFSKLFTG